MIPTDTSHRPIRSFVRREGRITPAQEHALKTLWERYGVDCAAEPVDGQLVFQTAQTLLDTARLFNRRAPVEVEIGCGNGDALLQMAAARPDHNFLGIEVYRPGVGKLLAGIEAAELDNVRVFHRDAVEVIRYCLGERSVHRIFVLFPDPWPKKRHHKRRLLQAPFVRMLAERLEPSGILAVATDWQPYAEFVMEVVSAESLLENVNGPGCFAAGPGERPLTKYERRGRKLGHEVFDIVMRRTR